jgi:tRNA 2-thiouridine synthesizing protein E
METTMMDNATAARLETKLDLVLAQMERIETKQRAVDELLELASPVMKVMLDGASETLAELEKAGYFAFGKEILRVVDRVVRSYSTADVQRLGDQVVGILDTVRNVTQPDVLAFVNDVTSAVHDADDADPKGLWGLMRAGKDPDVRKGFGVMVGVLKQVGRAADKIAQTPGAPPPVRLPVYQGKEGAEPPGWVKLLASRRASAAPAALPAPAAAAPSLPASPPPPSAAPSPQAVPPKAAFAGNAALPPGYGLDGFIKDPATWTREHGQALADLMSLTLTDAHWQVITWAREEYLAAQASPNIRRLSAGSGVAIRDLYALFPGKPGVLVAMLAGIPKPGGCL